VDFPLLNARLKAIAASITLLLRQGGLSLHLGYRALGNPSATPVDCHFFLPLLFASFENVG
jgi:hypothetical protein